MASQVLNETSIAASVNFTFVPLPGPPGIGGIDCLKADDVDVCAMVAADCVGGCTGQGVASLITFAGCFEGGFSESKCYPQRGPGCVAKAELNQTAYGACAAGGPKKAAAKAWIEATGKAAHIGSFPYVAIAGVHTDKIDTPKEFKAALCKAGVQAACK